MGSVGQRAANLPVIKLWEWFDPGWTRIQAKSTCTQLAGMAKAAHFFLRTPTLTASNFAALWPTDPKFLALKDLLFFLQCIEFQGADSILKVDFALSSRLHLHRAYVVTICNQIWIAVAIFSGFFYPKIHKICCLKYFWNLEEWKQAVKNQWQTRLSQ